jgi:ubiquinone/menaquinone biosynthesis C-methylase UbiE
MNAWWMFGLLLVLLLMISIAWRFASRKLVLPCPSWLFWMVDGSIGESILKTSETLRRMGVSPGQRILEIGPGPGRLLVPAAKILGPSGQAVGVELQTKMADKLRQLAQSENVENIAVIVGDATTAPIDLSAFDLVYLCTVLGEIPDRLATIKRSYAALKPGGRLSITEIILDPHYQRQSMIARLCLEAGFEHEATLGHWTHFTANFRKPS